MVKSIQEQLSVLCICIHGFSAAEQPDYSGIPMRFLISCTGRRNLYLPGSLCLLQSCDKRDSARRFDGCNCADAFYIPDSVKRIGSKAFAHSGYTQHYAGELFMRMPKHVIIAEDAFEKTKYMTRERACELFREQEAQKAAKEKKAAPEAASASFSEAENDSLIQYVNEAADDPAIGTGTAGRPELAPNIWQYFGRLSKEERIHELTHYFRIGSTISGVGWASVWIELDQNTASFRISYIGRSPSDFRKFNSKNAIRRVIQMLCLQISHTAAACTISRNGTP